MNSKIIAVICTLDTKGELAGYLLEGIRSRGGTALMIDGGIQGIPSITPDVSREKVAESAGSSVEAISEIKEEGRAIAKMAEGITQIVKDLSKREILGGIVGLGGGMGTSLCTTVMRDMPFGIPKLMVSTMAGGDVRSFVGTKDIMMFHTVADLVGLNVMTRSVLDRAAGAAIGMLETQTPILTHSRKVIGFATIGGTETFVKNCLSNEKMKGIESVVYHTNGVGGLALENAAGEGFLSGIVEVSVRELVDHLFGGICDGGPDRFTWKGGEDIPKIIIPGSADFIVYGPYDSLSLNYKNRLCHVHHHAMTLIRTNNEELDIIAKILAAKIKNLVIKPILMFPKQGFSCHDKEGLHFFDMEKNEHFLDKLKDHLKGAVSVQEIDAHINDKLFSDMAVQTISDTLL